jgi:GTPase SAR1 family protein
MALDQKKVTLERTLAVIGSTSVGKTALSQKFVLNSFPYEYYPTIEKS